MTPITLYLVRETERYGGGYTLSSFIPEASKQGLCWSFWAKGTDFYISQQAEEARKIEARLGFTLEPGTVVNLTTGQVTGMDEVLNPPEIEKERIAKLVEDVIETYGVSLHNTHYKSFSPTVSGPNVIPPGSYFQAYKGRNYQVEIHPTLTIGWIKPTKHLWPGA